MAQLDSRRSGAPPQIQAWMTPSGLRERYRYEPGPAGRGVTQVHADVQICFSHDAPGRYRAGRWTVNVPVGAVSIVDAWEPHAVEDPIAQPRASHYDLIYIARERWDRLADATGRSPRAGISVSRDALTVRTMRSLLHHADEHDAPLATDAALVRLVQSLTARGQRWRGTRERAAARQRDHAGLARARDLIHARLADGITLVELAAEAGVAPSYVVDAFRARFGLPPHRMQTLLRLDLARRSLGGGASIAEAAALAGFTDQSHLTRQFRRYVGTTPGRYVVTRPRGVASAAS